MREVHAVVTWMLYYIFGDKMLPLERGELLHGCAVAKRLPGPVALGFFRAGFPWACTAMRAFVVSEYAHPSKIQLTHNAPEPVWKPGSDDILIDIHSAGLNFFDVRIDRCIPDAGAHGHDI